MIANKPKKITGGVWWAGAVDWDRRLFDSLIPLPDGTSYNAYVVEGSEKTVLIDTVDPSKKDILLSHLDSFERIDYIVANHAEQDHSGVIPAVLDRYPASRVLISPRGKGMLIDLIHIPEGRVTTVDDGETLSLGGKTLEFLHTPWVHWPETISTYLREDRILFSCDLFGSHLAVSGLYSEEEWKVCEASKRYYAEVMMPFRSTIRKHLERFERYDIKTIAPSHGPVHKDPACILGYHREWVSEKVANTVVLAYVSMHGSTERMADFLSEELSQRGISVEKFNVAVMDSGKFAMSLVDAATLVIGTPTILIGAHPLVISAAFMANALRPKLKFGAIFGSYGWSGKAVEQITGTLSGLKLEMLPPVLVKGLPRDEDYGALSSLADSIEAKHREAGLY